MRIHRFTVGSFRCAVISDHEAGSRFRPWDMYFTPGVGVPRDVLTAALAEEGEVRPEPLIGYNCLAVQAGEQTLAIDTGFGREHTGPGEPSENLGRFVDGLEEIGMPAATVDIVVFTHLHHDHVGGAVWSGRPIFPSALHVASGPEVAFWQGRESDGYSASGPARVALKVAGERVRPVTFDSEIAPGVRALSAAGHTPGHMAVLLESAGQKLLCLGDSFYDRIQLRRPDWWTRIDVDGPASVAARRHLLDRAADESVPVAMYHMPFPGLGRIHRSGDAYEWVEGL